MESRQATRGVLLRDGDGWIAQCVDVDICAQGSTPETARERLKYAIAAELAECEERGVDLFLAIGPAPDFFRQCYEDPASIADITPPRASSIPPAAGNVSHLNMRRCA